MGCYKVIFGKNKGDIAVILVVHSQLFVTRIKRTGFVYSLSGKSISLSTFSVCSTLE